jgi:demethylmenaquinone methyltransferase/2-methoxy-6-polyprenyl-1,4-benzoquinol methylase
MAFGIRNIPDRTEALREMLRVTVPGGQIMILEMTFIENRFSNCFIIFI